MVTPDEVEDAFVAANPGMSRGGDRGDLRQQAAERSAHLHEQGPAIPRLPGSRSPHLPARQDRDAAGAWRAVLIARMNSARSRDWRRPARLRQGRRRLRQRPARDSSPMNYRHAFHAGNFADVVKHAILSRILAHLQKKGRAVSRHRYPCGRRRLRPDRRRKPCAIRNGATASAAFSTRRPAQRIAAQANSLLPAISMRCAPLNPDGRLSLLSRFARARAVGLRRDDRLIACELEPGSRRRARRAIIAATAA